MNLEIKKLNESAITPTYATEGSACFDIYAGHDGTVFANSATTFNTYLAFGIPDGHVMLVFSRSGHGFKHDTRLANCVGVVDSDYTGELFVKLTNDGNQDYHVCKGDRIAQAMLMPIQRVEFSVVEQLPLTERGTNGLGSTGR